MWKPISTAPLDGTPVLVAGINNGLALREIAWYGYDYNDVNEEYPGWWYGSGDDYSPGFYFTPITPTHWMEVPELPSELNE